MNLFLWVLQVLFALHTAMGAVWKFSHSEQTVASLKALPHSVWLAMSGLELLFSVCLVLPALNRAWGVAVPLAAAGIAAEMLIFCGMHLASGEAKHGEMIYWLVVAGICGLVAYGRLVLRPF